MPFACNAAREETATRTRRGLTSSHRWLSISSKNCHPQIQVNKKPFCRFQEPRRYCGCCSTCLPGGQQLPSRRSVNCETHAKQMNEGSKFKKQCVNKRSTVPKFSKWIFGTAQTAAQDTEELRVRTGETVPERLDEEFRRCTPILCATRTEVREHGGEQRRGSSYCRGKEKRTTRENRKMSRLDNHPTLKFAS